MDREKQIELEQQELERLESNAGVYDDDFVDEYAYIDQEDDEKQIDPINPRHLNYLKSVVGKVYLNHSCRIKQLLFNQLNSCFATSANHSFDKPV